MAFAGKRPPSISGETPSMAIRVSANCLSAASAASRMASFFGVVFLETAARAMVVPGWPLKTGRAGTCSCRGQRNFWLWSDHQRQPGMRFKKRRVERGAEFHRAYAFLLDKIGTGFALKLRRHGDLHLTPDAGKECALRISQLQRQARSHDEEMMVAMAAGEAH